MEELQLNNDKEGHDKIRQVEWEIAHLESKMREIKNKLQPFERCITERLSAEINEVRALTQTYKQLKKQKREKRQQQKRKGKNYRHPVVKENDPLNSKSEVEAKARSLHAEHIKRLYKKAIVHIHPDKILSKNEDEQERATRLTAYLNNFYKMGDLNALVDFYDHIISGNAYSYSISSENKISDSSALWQYLIKKKETLLHEIGLLESSPVLIVLNTYPDPYQFIEELQTQFSIKIEQLKRRTRKK